MADEQNPGGSDDQSADDQNDDQSASGSQADNDASQGGRDDSQENLSVEEARKLRSEAKNLRQRAKAAEAKVAELESAGLTEEEKRTKEQSTMQSQIETLTRTNRTLTAQVVAGKVGIIDPEAAAALLDWDAVDADDPKSLERAFKDLGKDRPWLLGNVAGGGDSNSGNDSRNAPADMNAAIRRAAGRG